MPTRRLAVLALGGAVLFAGLPALTGAASASAVSVAAVGAPSADLPAGRHIGTQLVTLTAEPGATIRYTLDGTEPTASSALYVGPVEVSSSATLTAVAFAGAAQSAPLSRGYVIKTAEEPLAQFAVMSDIHLSSDAPDLVAKWRTYFDALQRIAPHPDAIISNGDQINDNNHDTAADHRFPRAMLEQNLARTGMSDTRVLMSFGNHDDLVDRMAGQYPRDWFPHTGAGYYETQLGGFPAFVVNTEAWNATQASWLYGRLSAISADPATQGSPVFVFGHRPLPGTVWDGAQSSNPGLKSNLSDFPQVVFFSGHSHLNITDERSIHQDAFTSVNDGSMSYEETDTMHQSFGAGLAKEYTIPSAQSVLVEVYADRVEIDRINYAADEGRTYDDQGRWGFQKNPPFASTGTIAGPTWVIGRGATPAAVKERFVYTAANRNTTAPAWGTAAQPTVRTTATGLVLKPAPGRRRPVRQELRRDTEEPGDRKHSRVPLRRRPDQRPVHPVPAARGVADPARSARRWQGRRCDRPHLDPRRRVRGDGRRLRLLRERERPAGLPLHGRRTRSHRLQHGRRRSGTARVPRRAGARRRHASGAGRLRVRGTGCRDRSRPDRRAAGAVRHPRSG